MNQVATQDFGKNVAIQNDGTGFQVTPNTLSEVIEFSKFMCLSKAGIPSYLHNNGPDCAAIVMQALKWGLDPFSVAQKSYKVKDIIAYEAQLIAAVVNVRSGIKGRLRYDYSGEGETLTCTVTGNLDGEDYAYTSPELGQITTKNSPLWKTDPRQQLGYYSARSWARRYTPEVILGAYDREEAAQMRDVTPAQPARSLTDRFAAAKTEQAQPTSEGFDLDHVNQHTAKGEPEDADFTEAQDDDAEAEGRQLASEQEPEEHPDLTAFKNALAKAETLEAINTLNNEHAAKMNKLPEAEVKEARAAVAKRRQELGGQGK